MNTQSPSIRRERIEIILGVFKWKTVKSPSIRRERIEILKRLKWIKNFTMSPSIRRERIEIEKMLLFGCCVRSLPLYGGRGLKCPDSIKRSLNRVSPSIRRERIEMARVMPLNLTLPCLPLYGGRGLKFYIL